LKKEDCKVRVRGMNLNVCIIRQSFEPGVSAGDMLAGDSRSRGSLRTTGVCVEAKVERGDDDGLCRRWR
jgi:hypothetical protein